MYLATKVMMTGGSTDTLKHHLYRFPHGKLVDARIVTHVRCIDTRMKSQKLNYVDNAIPVICANSCGDKISNFLILYVNAL